MALTYFAQKANIVAGAPFAQSVEVRLDGVPLPTVSVQAHQLYRLASSPQTGLHTLMFNVSKGFQLYTFTFG